MINVVSAEEKFANDHAIVIDSILSIQNQINDLKEKQQKLRDQLVKDMISKDMRIVRIPEKHIRLQISGGKYTVRFDRKYFEKQNGPIDNKFFTTSCSDPYLMIYPTGTQCKIREKGHRKKK